MMSQSPPPPLPPPPLTPRAGYAGVMASTLDLDACAMVVTSDSGTDPAAPEVDFCSEYGQVVLVRVRPDICCPPRHRHAF